MRSSYFWPSFPTDLKTSNVRTLSLLFMLQEWGLAMKQLKKIKGLENSKLLAMLEKFLLFSAENPFTKNGGFLDKLCYYSDLLIKASKIDEEKILALLEEMETTILQIKSTLTKHKKKAPKIELQPKDVRDSFRILDKQFIDFFFALVPYIHQSRTDENIIMYLLEKKEEINQLLAHPVIDELIFLFFPDGPSHLRVILYEGFTRRGFSSLLKEKESLINGLKWSAR